MSARHLLPTMGVGSYASPGWFIAFQGAVACGVGCELYKYIAKQFIVEAELAGYEEDEDGNVKGSVKTDEVAITVDK